MKKTMKAGAPKKLAADKVVPVLVYVKRKNKAEAKLLINEVAKQFK